MTRSPKTQQKNSPPSQSKLYYPAFLDLNGKQSVIIGGGKVAERKCSSLIKTGAEITLISPEITKKLENYLSKGLIRHKRREYKNGDIKSAFLTIVATDSAEVNRRVYVDAKRLNRLINVADNPSLCTFIVPSLVRRGDLTIAVSTGGASPVAAKAIRKELELLYGPEIALYLKRLKEIRLKALKEIPDKKERERFLKGIVDASGFLSHKRQKS